MSFMAVLAPLFQVPGRANDYEGFALSSVPFETIPEGASCRMQTKKDFVIRDQAEWTAVWSECLDDRFPESSPPAVDFTKEMVIGTCLGKRLTGGFSVKITDISIPESASGLRVKVEDVKPGRGRIVTQAITFPCHIARLSRHDGPVVFDHSSASGELR